MTRESHDLNWNYTGTPGSSVKLELLKGGIIDRLISADVSVGNNGQGVFHWQVPVDQISGNDYKIRVTSNTNSKYTDESNSYFSIITAPVASLALISPNGGEDIAIGSTYLIRWTANGNVGKYLKIELLKSGLVKQLITTRATASKGVYSWKINRKQSAGDDYQIRITSASYDSYSDTSENYFMIR